MPGALNAVVDWVQSIGDGVIRAIQDTVNDLTKPAEPWWASPPVVRRCAYCGRVFHTDRKGLCRSCGAPEEWR